MEKNGQEQENYLCYGEDDLKICDTVCQACAFRWPDDAARCRKYPQGKPAFILDPNQLCPFFTVIDLEG